MRLRKFSLCKLLGLLAILISQSVVAYEPASLMDGNTSKYKTGTIDSVFYYGYWMPTMASNYGSEAAVRESFAPSAMVDVNGDLYAITLYGFSGSNGPYFEISKYSNGSLSKSISNFYPWTKIPGVTPNCQSTPSFNHSNFSGINASESSEKTYFEKYIHNAFMPCLAQEISGGSDHIYGFIYIPTTRLMNIEVTTSQYSGAENGATEGILFFKLNKNGLSALTTKYIPHTAKASKGIQNRRVFQYNKLRLRKWGTYQPQWGNFTACYNSNNKKIYLWHVADNNGGTNNLQTYRSTFSESGTFENLVETASDQWNRFLIPKVVCAGNYIYLLSPTDGVTISLFKQSLNDENKHSNAATMPCFQYLEYATYNDETGEVISIDRTNAWSWSCFPFDFLVLEAADNKKVWCALGFQGANDCHKNPPKSRFENLKNFYLTKDQGWFGTETGDTGVDDNGFANTYCNFNCKKASLVLWCATLNDTSATYYREHTPNIIYTTNVTASGATQATNDTANNTKRLYLNTQKVCTYKNYIIYAYCYPGKGNGQGNHLYIGYAPYLITSDARLRLLTKTEFKDASDNSFITDCSRIISLDCKNGHVWLTYMNSNNTVYKYFYIKASDLVGE